MAATANNVIKLNDRKIAAQQSQFNSMAEEIRKANPRRIENAQLAQEYDRKAKLWMEGWKREIAPVKAAARAAINEVLALEKRGLQAPETLRIECANLLRGYYQSQRERAEAEARAQELAAKEAAERQRQAELAHMAAVGRSSQEVQAVRDRPLPPIAVMPDPDAGKIVDISMIDVWLPESDDKREVVFRSPQHFADFLTWVRDNPAFHHLISVNYGPLKKLLSDNRGLLQPPGLTVLKSTEVRNRGKE